MDYGKDSYTTIQNVATYLDRTLDANEQAILAYVIPSVSRWIDRTLGTNFDRLDNTTPFGSVGSGWTQRYFAGGYNEINIIPCQQVLKVEAINPYDLTTWYTYSTPLEYMAEPYNLPVKTSLRLKMNEFTGGDAGLVWPGDEEGIRVTALFTEYDYVANDYPNDIKILANHVCAVWLNNNQNTEVWVRESVEGHQVSKAISKELDLIDGDPMVTRVLQSREQIWVDMM